MRRIFDTRARLAVYFENADLLRLTALARQEGKLLAEWARETLLGELEDSSAVRPERRVPVRERGVAAAERSALPRSDETTEEWYDRAKPKPCKHGALPELCRFEECRRKEA